MALTAKEKVLAGKLEFDESVLEKWKRSLPPKVELEKLDLKLYVLSGEKYDRTQLPDEVVISDNVEFQGADCTEFALEGVSALLPYQKKPSSVEIVEELQKSLLDRGYLLYLNYRALLKTERDKLALIKSSDPLDMLRMAGTNGCNFDISSRDVVDTIDKWREKAEFILVGAGNDWVHLSFSQLPEDIESFAKEVYEFCPDVIEQNYVGPPLDNGDFEAMMEAIDEQTTADLAAFLNREKYLPLWWD